MFRKTHESLCSLRGAKVIYFTVFFLQVSRSLTFLSLSALTVFSNLSHSLIFAMLADRLFYRMYDFLQPCELWEVWCLLLSAGFLFTPLRPDSLLTPQFTLCGKQDSALCVGFASSWHGDRPRTKPDDNAQQPQQTQPTKLPIRANRVCKI